MQIKRRIQLGASAAFLLVLILVSIQFFVRDSALLPSRFWIKW
jgi:hypothetical protein